MTEITAADREMLDAFHGDTVQILAAIAAYRIACVKAGLDAAAMAAQEERLCEPNPESGTDEAYDRGVDDVVDSIRQIDPTTITPERKP